MRVFISGSTSTLKLFDACLTSVEKQYCILFFDDDPFNELTDSLQEYIVSRMTTAINIFCLFEDSYFARPYTLFEFDLVQQSFLEKLVALRYLRGYRTNQTKTELITFPQSALRHGQMPPCPFAKFTFDDMVN